MVRYRLIALILCCSFVFECSAAPSINIPNNIEDIDRGKDDQVDCLGMGSLVARVLEWLFKKKPESSDVLEPVKYFIYTRNSKGSYKISTNDYADIQFSHFDIKKKTVIIVHGFLADGEESWIQDLTDAYLKLEDVNVIVVDWSEYSNTWNYLKAVVNAENAALRIVSLMKGIVNTYPQAKTLGGIHMIGHSLGAHVCGLVAEEFKKAETNWKISRITGLDPAQPCFVATDLSLSRDDAEFVDVIHTNGKMVAGMGLGLVDPIGHVDFYPNGGQRQPGCKYNQTLWGNIGIPTRDIMESVCSHRRSYEYFIDSLNLMSSGLKHKFWAHRWNHNPKDAELLVGEKCDHKDCTEMGINADKYNHSGTFFVTAASNQPFYVISPSDEMDVLDQLLQDRKKYYKSTELLITFRNM